VVKNCTHIHSYFRGMAKKRRSANQREKRRQQSRERNERFLIKKDNERSAKDMAARQAALDKLGIKLEFGFDDHRGAYSFADHRAPLNQPPIKTIDASVPPPAVTAHPEYPWPEFSTPPAFNVAVDVAVRKPAADCAAGCNASRARRAKAILQMHVKAFA